MHQHISGAAVECVKEIDAGHGQCFLELGSMERDRLTDNRISIKVE